MKKCLYCGADNPDTAEICEECGVSFEYYDQERPLDEEEKKILANNEKLQEGKRKRSGSAQSGKTHPAIRKKPGGLAALALFSIILCHIGALLTLGEYLLLHLACLIPGLVAFMNAINLNAWETYERQEKEENLAILLCVVSLILGVVLLLL